MALHQQKRQLSCKSTYILHPSNKQVGIAKGRTSHAKHITKLWFPQLSPKANQADTFDNFPTSLMSVDKTTDNSAILIFTTKDGVTVF
jgi:hypothetical protein